MPPRHSRCRCLCQDFIEIPLVDIASVDAEYTRSLLERHDLSAVRFAMFAGAGLGVRSSASRRRTSQGRTRQGCPHGAKALTGVTYGGPMSEPIPADAGRI